MVHRLTVLALVLLLASPVCWCGWMHAAPAHEVPACCQMRKDKLPAAPSGDHRDTKDCPCSLIPKVRSVAEGKLTAPKVPEGLAGPMMMVPVEIFLSSPLHHAQLKGSIFDHHPPEAGGLSLYLLHHQLLI